LSPIAAPSTTSPALARGDTRRLRARTRSEVDGRRSAGGGLRSGVSEPASPPAGLLPASLNLGYARLTMKHTDEKPSPRPNLTDRLDALTAFLPIFEDLGFSFGSWVGGKPMPHQLSNTPSFVPSDPAQAFVRVAHDTGWVLADLDWKSWKNSAEARELVDAPEALARATPEQLAKLLTALVRQERFVEGSLAQAFDLGILVAILRRADALLREVRTEEE
jgi:hypothetical protein